MSSPRKPTAGFWITVALVVVLAGYPLSFGPACWGFSRSPEWEIWITSDRAYHPILWAWRKGPSPIRHAINWYANIGSAFEVAVGENDARRFGVVRAY